MGTQGEWLAKIEGRLAASEYLMRLTMARLLKVDGEGRDLVLSQVRLMVQQLDRIALDEDAVSQAFIAGERSVLQQLITDFDENAPPRAPTLTIVPGGKAGEPDET